MHNRPPSIAGTAIRSLTNASLGVSMLFLAGTQAHAFSCAINTAPEGYAATFEDSRGNQRHFLYKIPADHSSRQADGFPAVFVFHGGMQICRYGIRS